MGDVDGVEKLEESHRDVLGFSVVASTIVLKLLADIGRLLITPLADIDLDKLDFADMELVLTEAQATAQRLRDSIRMGLQTHADIEEAAGIDLTDGPLVP